jgi:hypothetical protein
MSGSPLGSRRNRRFEGASTDGETTSRQAASGSRRRSDQKRRDMAPGNVRVAGYHKQGMCQKAIAA